MAKDFATVLGIGLILIGVFGFAVPGFLGVSHPVVHIAAGFVALWLGFWGSAATAKRFCVAFGAAYVLFIVGGRTHDRGRVRSSNSVQASSRTSFETRR